MHQRTLITAIISLTVLSACSASSSPDSGAKTRRASSAIATSLDKAWTKAKAGKNPTMACARVKGYAISNDSASARAALAQCNYDIPLRYFGSLLDQVDAGERTCNDFMMTIATQLRPMTMSMGGLKKTVADAAGKASDAEAQREAGSLISGAIHSKAGKSASERVKAGLRERAIAACPTLASYMES